jgi:hypothetical protein
MGRDGKMSTLELDAAEEEKKMKDQLRSAAGAVRLSGAGLRGAEVACGSLVKG